MDLCAASWEVIRMTSRTIRGLVPDLSGDGGCISSSAHFAGPPREGRPLISGGGAPLGCKVTGKVASLCMYCVQLRMYTCTYL